MLEETARDQRARLIAEARSLLEVVKDEGRVMSDAEAKVVNDKLEQADSLRSRIEIEETPLPRKSSPTMPENQPIASISPFRDKEGRAVPFVDRETRASTREVLRSAGRLPEDDGKPLHVGRLLRGWVTGSWDGAERERRSLQTGIVGSGAELVEPILSAEVIELARAQSVSVAAGARIVPMPGGELEFARQTADPVPAWTAEGAAIPNSDPSLDRVSLRARKLAVITDVSRELLQDGVNSSAMLQQVLGASVAAAWDAAILTGDGTGETPTGVINTPGIGDHPGLTLDYDDILDAMGLITAANETPRVWITDPGNDTALAKLKDGQQVYVVPPPSVAALSKYVTSAMPSTDVLVGDFSQVYLGIRQDIRIEIDAAPKWETDLVSFRCTMRADCAVARPAAIAKISGIT